MQARSTPADRASENNIDCMDHSIPPKKSGTPYRKPETYDPGHLLNMLLRKLDLKNDAALGIELEIRPPLLSKIRNRRVPISAAVLIRMHEVSGLTIGELRALMGDRRQQFRITNVPYQSTENSTSQRRA